MSQIEGQITKTNVNLLPSSFKKNKSNNRSILGHRTSGNRIVHFDSFYSFFSFFFQCNLVLKCSIAIYRAVSRVTARYILVSGISRVTARYIAMLHLSTKLHWKKRIKIKKREKTIKTVKKLSKCTIRLPEVLWPRMDRLLDLRFLKLEGNKFTFVLVIWPSICDTISQKP